MSLIGQTIRGYQFQKKIGQGGFGVVYLAWQEAVERTVAIKVILPVYANEPEFQFRFETEARLVASLEHPHIIPLYDFWQDCNGAYLVMRYVPEGTLEDLLAKGDMLSWSQTRRIILQLVEALEIAHDKGVIHRDIKPANVLLDDRGNAYLTDFGIAWLGENTVQDNTISGTIAYLAPELLQGGTPSPQSDLYALGMVVYEMLTGAPPFVGDVAHVMYSQVNESPPSILTVRPDLPPIIESLIFRLTMKNAEDRYTSASQLLAELENEPTFSAQAPKATVSMLAKRKGLQQLSRQGGNTLELRNRFSMIETVYSYWIEGVLENLLSGFALLDLDLNLEPEYVTASTLNMNYLGEAYTQSIAETADSILEIFEAYNGKLLILGEPGVGKSTLLLALTRDLLQQANEDEDFPIPIVFNLSSWTGKASLDEWIEEELHEKYQVPRSIASRWVKNDSLLLLLDGLDEVHEDHRQHCLEAINTFRQDHSFVDVVVSCRQVNYEVLSDKLNLNGAVSIQPLSDEQVTDYLNQVGDQADELKRILHQNPEMRELSHSPLMLGVMLTAYQDVTLDLLPDFSSLDEQREYLFDLYVQRAYQRRNAEKTFTLDDIRNWFGRLASEMQDRSQAIFFVEDLQPDWLTSNFQRLFHNRYQLLMMLIFSLTWLLSSVLFLEPDEYIYYAALGAVWGWSLFFGVERLGITRTLILFVLLASLFRLTLDWDETLSNYFQKSLFRSTLPYTLIIGILATLYHRTGQTSRQIHSVDALHFSIRSTRWIAALAGVAGGLLVTIPNFMLGEPLLLQEIVVKVIGTGLVAWSITGFRSNQLELSAQINEKIHRSFRNGIRMGLVGGIVVMLLVGIAFYPTGFSPERGTPALFNFLPLAMTTFFIYGGAVALQHYLLRRELVRQRVIPSQLIDLLKEGIQLGIVRRVGGGVIFIHRYLLEYFASLSKTKQET